MYPTARHRCNHASTVLKTPAHVVPPAGALPPDDAAIDFELGGRGVRHRELIHTLQPL
jgi:hypothetical protein